MATPMCPGSDDSMKVTGDESQHRTELSERLLKRFQISRDGRSMTEVVSNESLVPRVRSPADG